MADNKRSVRMIKTYLNWGCEALGKKDYRLAKAYFKEALELHIKNEPLDLKESRTFKSFLDSGYEAVLVGNYTYAERCFKQALDLYPKVYPEIKALLKRRDTEKEIIVEDNGKIIDPKVYPPFDSAPPVSAKKFSRVNRVIDAEVLPPLPLSQGRHGAIATIQKANNDKKSERKYIFCAISPDTLQVVKFEIEVPDLEVLRKSPPSSSKAAVLYNKGTEIQADYSAAGKKIGLVFLLIVLSVAIGFAAYEWLIPWMKSFHGKEIRTVIYAYSALFGVWLAGGVGVTIYVTITHDFDDIYDTIQKDFGNYFYWGAIGFIGVALVAIVGLVVIAVIKAIIELIITIVKAVFAIAVIIGIIAAIASSSDSK